MGYNFAVPGGSALGPTAFDRPFRAGLINQHPSPLGHGWHLLKGLCLPVRYSQPSLPPTITLPVSMHVDNTAEGSDHSNSDSSSSSDEYTDSSDDERHE